jgi:hypothetical protein
MCRRHPFGGSAKIVAIEILVERNPSVCRYSDNEHNQTVDLKEFLKEKDFIHNKAAKLIKNQSQVYKTKQENGDLYTFELTMEIEDNGTKRNHGQFPDPKILTPEVDRRFYDGI